MASIYFNNAATAWPKAPGLGDILAAHCAQLPVHPGRSGFEAFAAPDPERDCREELAALFRVSDADQILPAANATHATNMALLGMDLREGDVVLTTMAEHNAVLRPLYFLRRHAGIRLVFLEVEPSGRVDPARWEEALKAHSPRLAVFTHASNVTGAINDAATLCSLARHYHARTLVDASQSAGCADVFPEVWGADMLAFTGHKYLLGPLGTGGLWLSPDMDLEPVLTGGTGILSDLTEMPGQMPIRFEVGTPNSTAFAGLAHALAWAREHPLDAAGMDALLNRLTDGLAEAGAQLIAWDGPHTPVLSFVLPDIPPEDTGEMLQSSFGIVCRTGLHCAPLIHQQFGLAEGTVRFSLSRFTTKDEVEAAIAAVRAIVG